MSTTSAPLSERRRRQKQRQYALGGLPAFVDATPVWAHVDELHAEDWGISRIAIAADVTPQLVHYRLPTIHRVKAARILAVSRADLFAAAVGPDHVPAIGARRRLLALNAMGWPTNQLVPYTVASRLLHTDRKWVQAETWWAIHDIYERLAMTVGPSARTMQIARRNGSAPPLAWDDDDIDNPTAEPQNPQSDWRSEIHADRLTRVTQRTAAGASARQIAAELGITERTVQRLRTESILTNAHPCDEHYRHQTATGGSR